MATVKANKVLERSESNRVVAGVCGGLGEFLGIDPNIVRWAFVIFTLFGGSGVLVYLVLWLLIPSPTGALVDKKNLEESVAKVKTYAENHNPGKILGLFLLVIGFIFLLDNLGIHFFYLNRLWPLVLVGLGIYIFARND
jgi:phage shock protein C